MVSPDNGLIGSSRRRLVSNNSKFFKPDSTPFRHTTSNPNTYLGIWFNKVPKLTPLWSFIGDSPVVDPASPELSISGDDNLVILDQATKSVIWSTRTITTTNDTVTVLRSLFPKQWQQQLIQWYNGCFVILNFSS